MEAAGELLSKLTLSPCCLYHLAANAARKQFDRREKGFLFFAARLALNLEPPARLTTAWLHSFWICLTDLFEIGVESCIIICELRKRKNIHFFVILGRRCTLPGAPPAFLDFYECTFTNQPAFLFSGVGAAYLFFIYLQPCKCIVSCFTFLYIPPQKRAAAPGFELRNDCFFLLIVLMKRIVD